MKLYVKYPNNEWKEFIETDDTTHQKSALDKFINSNEETMEISIPCDNWTFKAIFKKLEISFDKILYFYTRQDKKIVQFIYLEDEYIWPNLENEYLRTNLENEYLRSNLKRS